MGRPSETELSEPPVLKMKQNRTSVTSYSAIQEKREAENTLNFPDTYIPKN